jgi:hypothetical protein
MKLFKLLFVAIIAFGMMACNNEQDVPEIIDGPEATVSVMVVPTSNGSTVRLAGDLSPADAGGIAIDESNIKMLEVFIFSGGLPDGYGKATSETTVTQVLGITTHSGPKTFYVVANADIKQVATEAELLAKTKDIPVDISKGLPMTSKGISVDLVAGENQYGFSEGTPNYKGGAKQHGIDTPAQLVRVNARVAIVSAVLDNTKLPADQLAIFDALTDIQVAMFNVPKTSNLFGASLAINDDFLLGNDWPTTEGSYMQLTDGGVLESSFEQASALNIVSTDAPYFYVTENDGITEKERMLIVLRGKPTKGGDPVVSPKLYTDASGYTYYPVWVNATKAGYTYTGDNTGDNIIRRNTQYNIALSIYGIGNPTIDPTENAFLDVNVSVAPWLVVTQNVDWGTPPVAP